MRIGVVGFSRNAFDKIAAKMILDEEFKVLAEKFKGTSVEIVSGYTKSGVPEIAYELEAHDKDARLDTPVSTPRPQTPKYLQVDNSRPDKSLPGY